MNLATGISWSPTVTPLGLDLALRATVLLMLVLGLMQALGRRRASVGSAIGNAGLVGLILLPFSMLALPRLPVACLPGEKAVAAAKDAPSTGASLQTAGLREFAADPDPRKFGDDRSPSTHPAVVVSPRPARAVALPPDAKRPTDWPGLVLSGYGLVVALLLARLAASLAAVSRLRRTCVEVVDRVLTDVLERSRRRLGIRARVALAWSDRVSVPVIIGWFRPTVVLPASLSRLDSTTYAEPVLLHELAHVRRGDYAWNILLRIVRALYWPHPLVWVLGRSLALVRERACDDLCVHELGSPSAYGETLLTVASGLVRRPGPALGLAMARTSKLGRRLDRIAQSRGDARRLPRWPVRLAVAAAVVALAGVIGSIELARTTAKAAQEPKARVANLAQEPKQAEAPKADLSAPAPAPPPAIEIVVMGTDTNKPLEGARVRTSMDFVETLWKTDREGRVRIDLSKLVFQDQFSFDVWADGYVQQRYSFFGASDPPQPKIPERMTVFLLPGEETLGGKVTNEEGRPIAGARVVLWGYLGEKKEPHEGAYMVDTTTDENGEWRCRSCRKMTFAYLYLSHPDYVADEQTGPRIHGQPRQERLFSPDDPAMKGLRDFSDLMVMTRGVAIIGRVTDKQGQPVANAEVGRLEANHLNTFSWDMPKTSTDTAGRFQFPHVQPASRRPGSRSGISPIGWAILMCPLSSTRAR